MPYTEATMLEILRLSSVVPITGRRPIQDARIGNYTVPKGMMTTFNLYSYHHNEILWEEPFQFRPERFLDASQKVVNTDKIIPFGLGKGQTQASYE
jgi:cytochrome P450